MIASGLELLTEFSAFARDFLELFGAVAGERTDNTRVEVRAIDVVDCLQHLQHT